MFSTALTKLQSMGEKRLNVYTSREE